jgi:hypothetical protein
MYVVVDLMSSCFKTKKDNDLVLGVRNFGALRSEMLIALLYHQLLAVVQFLVDT